jgi:hypothetical protein
LELITSLALLLRAVLIYFYLFLNIISNKAYFSSIFLHYGSKQEAVTVPLLKKGDSASVSNYRQTSLLNNFSKLFEFVTHDHVSHYLKLNISLHQHGFSKPKSASTNLVTNVDFISPLVWLRVKLMPFVLI